MNNLDSQFINPVITTPFVSAPDDKNVSCESIYGRNLTTLDHNLFPFLSLGFNLSAIVASHSITNLKATFEKSYYDTALHKERIRITWDLLQADFNVFTLKVFKNSTLFLSSIVIKTATEFELFDAFNINDRYDIVLIPITNSKVEILNKNNVLSLFVVREEIKEHQYEIFYKKSDSIKYLDFSGKTLSSLSKFLVFNAVFENSINALKIKFKYDMDSDIQGYKILYNRVGNSPNQQTVIQLEKFQDIVSIDSFNFDHSYVIAVIPTSKKYGDIYLENNIYDVSFIKLADKTCTESKVDLTKYKNLIPESFQLENSSNLVGEVHSLISDIALNLEEPYAQYKLENLRTEFRLSNQVTENFIWSVDDLILAKNTFALKGTQEGFLYALSQSGIDVTGLSFNNMYNGSEVLVKIPTDSPDFLKYLQADRLAQIFLPIYTTFTSVTNCEETVDMSPARFGWNAVTGSKTRIGRNQGQLQPDISKNIYFLLCRKTETAEWELEYSIESIQNHVIVSELDLTRFNNLYDRDLRFDYMQRDLDASMAWYSVQGSISMTYMCYWAESEQDILDGICDVDYPEKYREPSKHTRQCNNSATFGRSVFGDDVTPIGGGARSITTWENGLDDQVLGDYVLGGIDEPVYTTSTVTTCGLSRNVRTFDATFTVDIDESFNDSDSLTTIILTDTLDLTQPASLVFDNSARTGYQILDDSSGNQSIHTTQTFSVMSIWASDATQESYEQGLSLTDPHGFYDARSSSLYKFSAIAGYSIFGDDFSPLGGFETYTKTQNGLGSASFGNYKLGGGTVVTKSLGGIDSFVDVMLGGNLYPFEQSVEIVSDDQYKLQKTEIYRPEYVHRKTGGNLTDLRLEYSTEINHKRTHQELKYVNHAVVDSLGYTAKFDVTSSKDFVEWQSRSSKLTSSDLITDLSIEYDTIWSSVHVSDFVYEGFEYDELHSTARVSESDCTREVYETVAHEVIVTDLITDYGKWPFTSFRTLKLLHIMYLGNNSGYGIYSNDYNPTAYRSLNSIDQYPTSTSRETV